MCPEPMGGRAKVRSGQIRVIPFKSGGKDPKPRRMGDHWQLVKGKVVAFPLEPPGESSFAMFFIWVQENWF